MTDSQTPPAMPAPSLEALHRERAELQAANDAATGWGADVGARAERIREIDRAISAASTPEAEPGRLDREAVEQVAKDVHATISRYERIRASHQDGQTNFDGANEARDAILALALTQPSRPRGETGGEAVVYHAFCAGILWGQRNSAYDVGCEVARRAASGYAARFSVPSSQPARSRETEGVSTALKKALEFTVLVISFIGRDKGTSRLEGTLDDLTDLAVKLDPLLRAALATAPSPSTQLEAENKFLKHALHMVATGQTMNAKAYAQGQLEDLAKVVPAPALDAGKEAGVAAGWRLVPEEPTEAMTTAASYALDTPYYHDVETLYRAMLAASPPQPGTVAGWQVSPLTKLPDGSGFFTASFPLPNDHWLYQADADGFTGPPPMPLRMGTDDPRRQEMNEKARAAARWAIRASTTRGQDNDFDPDAMVQNFVVALLGYHSPDALSSDAWDNPDPVPPTSEFPAAPARGEGGGA